MATPNVKKAARDLFFHHLLAFLFEEGTTFLGTEAAANPSSTAATLLTLASAIGTPVTQPNTPAPTPTTLPTVVGH
jgi:hypothetical protein